ncbi:hypothetical protein [Actinacidiphila oryziradicis]|uniref:hypothetical protein n=1 Tax=Actinacidiphila oryziradicis TaxID=2571141 RepID=UPI00145F4AD2|nr:hypothetical protein [Actinacidiphila oryziradicis]
MSAAHTARTLTPSDVHHVCTDRAGCDKDLSALRPAELSSWIDLTRQWTEPT